MGMKIHPRATEGVQRSGQPGQSEDAVSGMQGQFVRVT
jgi:hypothetical protein